MTDNHDRHVAVVLYGFAKNPRDVAREVGSADVEVICIGDLVGRRPSAKNRITWRRAFFNDDAWKYPIDGLIAELGGPARLKTVLRDLTPAAAWLRICVPSAGSPWQESGGMSLSTMSQLVEIGLGFDLAAFAFDAANPTHGLRPEPVPP
jgi:hypothetical protein